MTFDPALVHAHLMSGDTDEALYLLDQAIAVSPSSSAPRRLRAQLLARTGQWQQALDDLNVLTDTAMEDDLLRVRLLNALEQPHQACHHLEMLLAQADADVQGRIRELLYSQYMLTGNYEGAIALAELRTEDWRWRQLLADALAQAGRPATARTHYAAARAHLEARYQSAWPPAMMPVQIALTLGEACAALDSGDPQTACELLTPLQSHLNDPSIQFHLGRAWSVMGNHTAADEAIRQALERSSPAMRMELMTYLHKTDHS